MPSTTTQPATRSRGTRLEARISVQQKTVLQQAAALSGRTLSDEAAETFYRHFSF